MGCNLYKRTSVLLIHAFVHVVADGSLFHLTTDAPDRQIKVTEDTRITLKFNYTIIPPSKHCTLNICSRIEEADIAEFHLPAEYKLQGKGHFNATIKGLFVGQTTVHIYFIFTANKSIISSCDTEEMQDVQEISTNLTITNLCPLHQMRQIYKAKFSVVVVREKRAVDVAFNVVVVLLVLVVNLGMGCKTDLQVVKATLRRPVGPVTGFFSQFIFMPLISFAAAYTFSFKPAVALGFFALGCSPGGSASNAYTLFLGGDVSLSITMTFISTLASLGMIPLWLSTLGRKLYSGTSVRVPVQNIVFSLLGLIVPVCIGIFIQHKRPAVAKQLIKVSKAVMILFLLFVMTVGIYANVYIFRLMESQVLITAALLPYLGFALGGLVAFAFCMSRAHIITIAVETGIQNTGIAIVMLLLSLEPPDSDISIVAPIASALFTPIPIWMAIAVLHIRKRWCNAGNDVSLDGEASNEQEMLQECNKSGEVSHS